MLRRFELLAGLLVASGLLVPVNAADPLVPGMSQLVRLDLLPRLKPSVFVGSVSSYDRTGGNDDGFSGKYSYVAQEEGGLVIADLEGPGVIYRIWTPTPSDDWFEFYFDGEPTPRIRVKFGDIFTGIQPPFVAPLVGFGAGGYYCYVPLPYEKSCKIVARAERVQFYQINYARYPDSVPIVTWKSDVDTDEVAMQQRAQALFGSAGKDLSAHVAPAAATCSTHSQQVSIAPGSSATLFEAQTGGRIVGIRIAPASVLSGKDRDLVLRITWDGGPHAAVLCPAGDFFGYAFGQPATRSLLVGTSEDISYCYFPMPFDKSAKIELLSERAEGPSVSLRAEVITVPVPRQEQEGRFHAVWRRENPTAQGRPFTFVDCEGEGHIVGCCLQAQGMVPGETLFFEGDDETRIDGEVTIRGTGSEDFFNGGWYDVPGRWEKKLSFPLSGCLTYEKPLGRTGGYRLMLGDAYAFRKSIHQTIEHAPTGNDMETDYVGVTFLYLAEPSSVAGTLPSVADRRVVDPTRIIFKPAWSVPIQAFTFRGATLTKMDEEVEGTRIAFLRMQSGEKDWFGAPFIAIACDLPAAGKYRVTIEAVKGPEQAVVQLYRDEMPAGEAVDLYAEQRRASGPLTLGTIDVEEGVATLLFKLVRKNDKSAGFGLDLATVECQRID
ncbi:MAG: glycoside hydrolase family 172 protein [Pirellulaceae bacterium]